MDADVPDFSRKLRAGRESLGLSINDVFKRTRIKVEFLRAIESGRLAALPEAYAGLFLKNYAQELGLDPSEVLDGFAAASPFSRAPAHPYAEAARPPAPAVVLSIVVLLVLLVGIASQMTRHQGGTALSPLLRTDVPTTASDGARAPRTPHDRPAGRGPADSRERVVSAYSVPLPSGFARGDSLLTLSLSALRRTHVGVFTDGDQVFDGEFGADRKAAWQARRRFRADVAHGQAVRIVFHGQPIELATPPGNKLRIFLSRSSIWVEELEVSTAASDL